MITGISLRLVSFVDSWDWGRRSMQPVAHTLARFLGTLTGGVSPAPGLREPYRVADMIIDIFISVMREMEQEWFVVEVR